MSSLPNRPLVPSTTALPLSHLLAFFPPTPSITIHPSSPIPLCLTQSSTQSFSPSSGPRFSFTNWIAKRRSHSFKDHCSSQNRSAVHLRRRKHMRLHRAQHSFRSPSLQSPPLPLQPSHLGRFRRQVFRLSDCKIKAT